MFSAPSYSSFLHGEPVRCALLSKYWQDLPSWNLGDGQDQAGEISSTLCEFHKTYLMCTLPSQNSELSRPCCIAHKVLVN